MSVLPHIVHSPEKFNNKGPYEYRNPKILLDMLGETALPSNIIIRSVLARDQQEIVELFTAGMLSHSDFKEDFIDCGIKAKNPRLQPKEDFRQGFMSYIQYSCITDLKDAYEYYSRFEEGYFMLVAEDTNTNKVIGTVALQPREVGQDRYASRLHRKLDARNIFSKFDYCAELHNSQDKELQANSAKRIEENSPKPDQGTQPMVGNMMYREGELRRMSVSPEYQGTGLAVHLIYQLLERARLMGLSAVHLTTAAMMRKAMRFYKKLGWDYLYVTVEKAGEFDFPVANFRWCLDEVSAQIAPFEDDVQDQLCIDF